MTLPAGSSRTAVLVGAGVWAAVAAGRAWGWTAAAVPLAGLAGTVVLRAPRAAVVAAIALTGTVSGALSAGREAAVLVAELPTAEAAATVAVLADPVSTPFGPAVRGRLETLTVDGETTRRRDPVVVRGVGEVEVGETLAVEGVVGGAPGRFAGEPVAGRISVDRVVGRAPPGVALRAANAARRRIVDTVGPARDPARALLAGFLVGDTSELPAADVEVLRRAGLSHYVAVSGGNVGLFLGLWWLVTAPASRRPRLRAATGLAGLTLFVLVTRWEPSVVRAAVMAGLVLVGRSAGISLDGWAALGWTAAGTLLVSGELADEVGFVLSAAATAGILAGSRMLVFRPAWAAAGLSASLAAQAAVAPILVAVFGTMPVLSPLANVVAAPLVTAATAVGGVGALLGVEPLVVLGGAAAHLVLFVGRVASPWPQIGGVGTVVAAGLVAAAAWKPTRTVGIVGIALGVVLLLGFRPGAARPALVFLDVGQGDAALILGTGLTVLIDGGPDPAVLEGKLAEYGVERIDLLILSHVHADHLEGLRAVVGRRPVGAVWHAFGRHQSESSGPLLDRLAALDIPTATPEVGTVLRAGDVEIEVLGPLRRYAGPNDESLVVEVRVTGTRVLFSGDAEVAAQADLGRIGPDILKVPHQGAATSDAAWLVENAGRVAVVSVGPNDYGHPAPWVVEELEGAGATVLRTDETGDIALDAATLEALAR